METDKGNTARTKEDTWNLNAKYVLLILAVGTCLTLKKMNPDSKTV